MSGRFDFREGMLLEKVVYKDTSLDCASRFKYIGYLLLTWAWGVAWFSLFFYLYIFHERVAFWIFVGCWIAFALTFIINSIVTLQRAKSRKLKKQHDRKEHQEIQEKIDKAKQEHYQQKSKKNDQHIQLMTEMEQLNA